MRPRALHAYAADGTLVDKRPEPTEGAPEVLLIGEPQRDAQDIGREFASRLAGTRVDELVRVAVADLIAMAIREERANVCELAFVPHAAQPDSQRFYLYRQARVLRVPKGTT